MINVWENLTSHTSWFYLICYRCSWFLFHTIRNWKIEFYRCYVTNHLIGKYNMCVFVFLQKYTYKSFTKMLNACTDNGWIDIFHICRFGFANTECPKICFLSSKNKHIVYEKAQNNETEHLRSNRTISCLYEILRK